MGPRRNMEPPCLNRLPPGRYQYTQSCFTVWSLRKVRCVPVRIPPKRPHRHDLSFNALAPHHTVLDDSLNYALGKLRTVPFKNEHRLLTPSFDSTITDNRVWYGAGTALRVLSSAFTHPGRLVRFETARRCI